MMSFSPNRGPWFSCNYAHVLKSKYPESGRGWQRGLDRVYMIKLRNLAEWNWVPTFLQNKYGREYRHGRKMSFCSVLSFPAFKHQEKLFMNFFKGICGHQEAWCMNSSWVTLLIVIRHLGKLLFYSFVNFRTTSLLHLLYFSTYSGIKTLFLILNICYEHNILVRILQQSYVNVH